jgi:hypothetical protein
MTPGDASAYLRVYLDHVRNGEWDAAWRMLSAEQRMRVGSVENLPRSTLAGSAIELVTPFLDPGVAANWLRNVATAERACSFILQVSYQTASDQDNSSWEVYAVGPDANGVLGIWGDLRGY